MTVDRIDELFRSSKAEKRTALVAYLCVGDPSVEDTLACALAALDSGADMLEIGVPFSDPTADGPVIAAASYRAIKNGGSLKAALEVARAIRKERSAPLVLFGYYNPVLAFGAGALPAAAADAGVDALLIVDLPPEEGAELRAAARAARVGMVPLLAPTSDDEREKRAFESGSGFVYYVSRTGVTGGTAAPLEEAGRRAHALRERAGLPVVVGFGIDTPDKARAVANAGVSGVVVGTAIVKAVSEATSTPERVEAVRRLVGGLRAGLDG